MTLNIYQALSEVMKEVPVVRKEDRNQAQNFMFRGIDAVLTAVGPALRKHGVVVAPEIQEHHAKEVTTKNNTKMNAVFVVVKYTFFGPEGDTLVAEVPGEAMDAGDKAFSKAMSVAFRTALLQTLALPTDEKDPDSEAYERSDASVTSNAATKKKTDADIAKDELLAKVRRMRLDPGDVAQLYYGNHGVTIQEEADAAKLRAFTERLEPAK